MCLYIRIVAGWGGGETSFSFYFLGKINQHFHNCSQYILLFLTNWLLLTHLACLGNSLISFAFCASCLCQMGSRDMSQPDSVCSNCFNKRLLVLTLMIATFIPPALTLASEASFLSLHPFLFYFHCHCHPFLINCFGVTNFPSFIKDEIHASPSPFLVFF